MTYHSAMWQPAYDGGEARRHESAAGVAFVHDVIADPLPDEYAECDVLYTDLPWRTGFAEFNERAGVGDGRTYRAFLEAVGWIVREARCPVVLVTGKHALPHLPSPDSVADVTLNGQPAIAACYRLTLAPWLRDTWEVLRWLAFRFECVGDFCCGYGRSAQVFAESGKRYVASDYNPACIGRIAEQADGWTHA